MGVLQNKRVIGEILLWMVVGSLAMELKTKRRDIKEWEEKHRPRVSLSSSSAVDLF
jgi:hypothetical protein